MEPRQRSVPLGGRQSEGSSPTARLRVPQAGTQNLGECPFCLLQGLSSRKRRLLTSAPLSCLTILYYIGLFPKVNPTFAIFCCFSGENTAFFSLFWQKETSVAHPRARKTLPGSVCTPGVFFLGLLLFFLPEKYTGRIAGMQSRQAHGKRAPAETLIRAGNDTEKRLIVMFCPNHSAFSGD